MDPSIEYDVRGILSLWGEVSLMKMSDSDDW